MNTTTIHIPVLEKATPLFLYLFKEFCLMRNDLGNEHADVKVFADSLWLIAPQSLKDWHEASLAEVKRFRDESTPEYLSATVEFMVLSQLHGPNHQEVDVAMSKALALAPESMRQFVSRSSDDLSLTPEHSSHAQIGLELFEFATIANKLEEWVM